MSNKYKVIGIMSGTSLDGLDLAYCEFVKKRVWSYKIRYAQTVRYSPNWKKKLSNAFKQKELALKRLDIGYGEFIGKEVVKFLKKHNLAADLIASHGHTVFHDPQKKYTLQIGNGSRIASVCKVPVVCDFRTGDVALGGQGAPLVPLVDRMLFSKYDLCLNLGGFANISYEKNKERVAFDICPVNVVLNHLSGELGKEFDRGGQMAAKGKIHSGLLSNLNKLSFYAARPPKSLGREWVETIFFPALDPFNIPLRDKLRTVVEHIAIQVAAAANTALPKKSTSLLITGGGAYNKFLVERITFHTRSKVILPDDRTIQFKEAMAFALLGMLRMRGEINILKSVTGAKKDSSGGKIFLPDQKAESSL